MEAIRGAGQRRADTAEPHCPVPDHRDEGPAHKQRNFAATAPRRDPHRAMGARFRSFAHRRALLCMEGHHSRPGRRSQIASDWGVAGDLRRREQAMHGDVGPFGLGECGGHFPSLPHEHALRTVFSSSPRTAGREVSSGRVSSARGVRSNASCGQVACHVSTCRPPAGRCPRRHLTTGPL